MYRYSTGLGQFVIRGALSEIQNSLTLHLRYTHPSDGGSSYGSHLTQDSPDSAYWFGQLGGGGNHASPVAGFVGDSTVFFTNLSSMSLGRWGDYSAIRNHWANPKLFSVSEYFLNGPNADRPTGQVIHQYRMFGRTADVGGTF